MNRRTILFAILCIGWVLALPIPSQAQDFQRISFGGDAVAWSVSEMDGFSVTLSGPDGTEIREIGDSVLFGFRPFIRFGLIRELDLEVSHEFSFGSDVDIMVSSATGIIRPFGGTGLELHASICYGQFDWGDIPDFDSAWGWEIGASYNFKLSRSAGLIVGVAYRDLSFEVDLDKTLSDLEQTRPGTTVAVFEENADAAGVVGTVGVLISF